MSGACSATEATARAVGMQPFYFDVGGRSLFGVLHPAAGRARALVLMCAPLLHEHVRSYRFFSVLADRLAGEGLACMRFDYHGTGDSGGDDSDFSPDAGVAEITYAASRLRALAGEAPLVLMGIRASALLAFDAVEATRAAALWLWQPITDGLRHLEEMEAQDLELRSSRDRYSSRQLPVASGPRDLMGFRLSSTFRSELASRRIVLDDVRIPVAMITAAAVHAPASDRIVHHVLPATVSSWAGEVDLASVIQLRDAEPVVEALLRDLVRLMPGADHG